jgi:predicted nucleic acid-binding protein
MDDDPEWVVCAVARTEAEIALCRLGFAPGERVDPWQRLREDWERCHVVPVDLACLARAADIGCRHQLRTLDALHLAAADRLPRPLVVLTFDRRQADAARSLDLMMGARYRFGQWVASAGLVYLGEAETDNPSERGQSNSLLVNTVGLNYNFGNGFELYGFGGLVTYGRTGLSPMSSPGNAAFTNIDSRISKSGNYVGVGAQFTF